MMLIFWQPRSFSHGSWERRRAVEGEVFMIRYHGIMRAFVPWRGDDVSRGEKERKREDINDGLVWPGNGETG